MGTWGRLRLRSSRLRGLSLAALKRWGIWCLFTKNPFRLADSFRREVFLFAPVRWRPSRDHRVWKLLSPAHDCGDASVASRKTLQRYVLRSEKLPALLGSGSSSRGAISFSVVVWQHWVPFPEHFDDVLGCGDPAIFVEGSSMFGAPLLGPQCPRAVPRVC